MGICTQHITVVAKACAADPLRWPRRRCRTLLVQQAGHTGQLLTLQELQRRAAAGADVGDFVGKAQLLYRSRAVAAAIKGFKDARVSVGAQNVFYEKNGAYTGEVSADMLKDLGVKYVIIGHSERRQYFGETDLTVNRKVLSALEAGLHPIICVGETLEQRELGITMELIALQVKSALAGVPAE